MFLFRSPVSVWTLPGTPLDFSAHREPEEVSPSFQGWLHLPVQMETMKAMEHGEQGRCASERTMQPETTFILKKFLTCYLGYTYGYHVFQAKTEFKKIQVLIKQNCHSNKKSYSMPVCWCGEVWLDSSPSRLSDVCTVKILWAPFYFQITQVPTRSLMSSRSVGAENSLQQCPRCSCKESKGSRPREQALGV